MPFWLGARGGATGGVLGAYAEDCAAPRNDARLAFFSTCTPLHNEHKETLHIHCKVCVHYGAEDGITHASPVPCLHGKCRTRRPQGRGSESLVKNKNAHRRFDFLMERKTGFEPATLALARRCSTTELLPHLLTFLMVPRDGIEPPTRGFSVLCSTD